MATSFSIFAATDFQGLVAEVNNWVAPFESFTSEIRAGVVSSAVDIETIRNGLQRVEMRTEQIDAVGNQAVQEQCAIQESLQGGNCRD